MTGPPASGPAAASPARGRRRWWLLALCLFFVALFLGLGIWQVERRAWKLALIDAVTVRVHAPPVPAPPPARWSSIDAARDAYRRVSARGRFLNDRETLVQALTEQGAGYWVMTPLADVRGFTILVNRGFVPTERAQPATRRAGQVEGVTSIVGLLRVTEPKGRFLRANQPAQDRWFSRDVAAIAQARGLGRTAPYFIDAEARPVPGGWPVGGLTVLAFPNNHLVYAITWFALAALSLSGAVLVVRGERR